MIASVVLAAALGAAPAAATAAEQARFDACLARVAEAPEAAYEDAMAWAHEAQAREARWCAGRALLALKRFAEAARRFESLAGDPHWAAASRADAYAAAGAAWLEARDPARARVAYDHVVRLTDADPDALIDRSHAFIALGAWPQAEEDLSAALDKRPRDALALRLRATVRIARNAPDLALRDAEAAVALEPRNVEALVTLGDAREAKRTASARPQPATP